MPAGRQVIFIFGRHDVKVHNQLDILCNTPFTCKQYEKINSFDLHNDLQLDWLVAGGPYRYYDRLSD